MQAINNHKNSGLAWVVFLFLTVTYVIAEIYFNTLLVNVAGVRSTLAEIQKVESLGRALSSAGFGLLIARVKFYSMSDTVHKRLTSCVFAFAVAFGSFYGFQSLLVNGISSTRDSQGVRDDFLMLQMKDAISEGYLRIGDFDLMSNSSDAHIAKTLLTIIGPIMYATPEIVSTLHNKREDFTLDLARQEHKRNLIRIYNDVYIPLHTIHQLSFEHYKAVSDQVIARYTEEARKDIQHISRQLMFQYANVDVSNRNSNLSVVKRFYSLENVSMQLRHGFGFPSGNWSFGDHKGFTKHFITQKVLQTPFHGRVNVRLRDLNFVLPADIPLMPGLGLSEFHGSPAFKQALLAFVNQTDNAAMYLYDQSSSRLIDLGLGFDDFALKTQQNFTNHVLYRSNSALNDLESFIDRNDARRLNQYVQGLWVPSLAMLISLVMVMINIVSLVSATVYRVSLVSSKNRLFALFASKITAALCIFLVTVGPFLLDHSLDGNNSYIKMIANLESTNVMLSITVDWLVRSQSLLLQLWNDSLPISLFS